MVDCELVVVNGGSGHSTHFLSNWRVQEGVTEGPHESAFYGGLPVLDLQYCMWSDCLTALSVRCTVVRFPAAFLAFTALY